MHPSLLNASTLSPGGLEPTSPSVLANVLVTEAPKRERQRDRDAADPDRQLAVARASLS